MEFVVTDRLLDTQPLLPTPWWRKWLVRWGVLKPRYGRPLREVLDIEKEDTPHLDDVDDLDVVADPDPYVSFSWGPPTGSEAEHSGPRAMRLKPSEPEMISLAEKVPAFTASPPTSRAFGAPGRTRRSAAPTIIGSNT